MVDEGGVANSHGEVIWSVVIMGGGMVSGGCERW